MARLPTVAIIGRPNAGKSSLFNRIVGRRQAIVSEVPGTTRDRVAAKVEGKHLDFLLIDTGGMGGGSEDSDLEEDVSKQSQLALDHADVIVFTISSREDLTASDYAIADLLRKTKSSVPVLIAFTKCDNLHTIHEELPRAYELNLGSEVIAVSAPHNFGIEDLTDHIEEHLKELNFQPLEEDKSDSTPRVAIIGKPNVGKSSLINAFLSEEARNATGVIVSDIPGTTRDAVDTRIGYEGKEYVFVDTAGLKRKSSSEEGLDKFASFRTLQALQHCDIAVLVLDASKELTRQDKRIATLAMEEGKGLVIVLNKIDLLSEEQRADLTDYVQMELSFCGFAPILPASAESKKNIVKLFNLIDLAQESRTRRIATKELHNWYTEAVAKHAMGAISGKHITQAEDIPPTFVLFVRDPKLVQLSQLKYLDRKLRENFGFEGSPVRWVTKAG